MSENFHIGQKSIKTFKLSVKTLYEGVPERFADSIIESAAKGWARKWTRLKRYWKTRRRYQ
ncbi:MAG: hypothetical protein DKT66_19690 [Candidatus Melainabacteria bacterium]|nr:MAG: hypothetical protein DKT66_19690 [Candidatus Melainabacteria bacterium]